MDSSKKERLAGLLGPVHQLQETVAETRAEARARRVPDRGVKAGT
jgi:hypothetical protein